MGNRWWEIKINYTPEFEDSVFWRLEEFGCKGSALMQENGQWYIKGYVPEISNDVSDLAAFSLWLKQDFILLGEECPAMTWRLIDDEDWGSSWKSYWHPMDIGEGFTVYPAWIEPPTESDKMIIRLDPGSAFGTGVHATTQLCLESLEMRLDGEEDNVIADIGCGSGILSIGARMLGAKKVVAVDVDPLAVKATIENTALNHIEGIEVFQGSINDLVARGDKFDGIVCNILAEVIKTMIDDMAEIVKPKGWLVLSGILVEQSMEISAMLEKKGFMIAALWKRDNWCCLNVRR